MERRNLHSDRESAKARSSFYIAILLVCTYPPGPFRKSVTNQVLQFQNSQNIVILYSELWGLGISTEDPSDGPMEPSESIMIRNITQKHTDPIGASAPRSERQSLSGSKAPSQDSEDSGSRRPGVAFISLLWGVKVKQLWTLGCSMRWVKVNSILSPGSRNGFENSYLTAKLPTSSASPLLGLASTEIPENEADILSEIIQVPGHLLKCI